MEEIYSKRGMIHEIFETKQVSERFAKREFVIETKTTNDRGTFIDYIKFQAVQEMCGQLDEIQKKDVVSVRWKLAGRKYKGRDGTTQYFTNLEMVDIAVVSREDGTGREDTIDDQLPMGEKEFDPLGVTVNDDFIPDPDSKEEEDDLPF